MINLDTVGRMTERGLLALGSGTALELQETLRGINIGYGFELGIPDKGPFASDHVPFFEAGVPVVHFTTGPNLDYHRASDTADKIATAELVEFSEFVAELVGHLADREDRLTYVPPGAAEAEKMAPAPGSAPRRVSLGTIPDFSRESGGVLLSGVMPESPADKAGLRKGDVLVEMDGTPVDNLGDFSGILKAHQPGDEVGVVVLRGEARITANVTLVERK
jgi:membrane-associated protease RseP (regulator of RpoE activity)